MRGRAAGTSAYIWILVISYKLCDMGENTEAFWAFISICEWWCRQYTKPLNKSMSWLRDKREHRQSQAYTRDHLVTPSSLGSSVIPATPPVPTLLAHHTLSHLEHSLSPHQFCTSATCSSHYPMFSALCLLLHSPSEMLPMPKGLVQSYLFQAVFILMIKIHHTAFAFSLPLLLA